MPDCTSQYADRSFGKSDRRAHCQLLFRFQDCQAAASTEVVPNNSWDHIHTEHGGAIVAVLTFWYREAYQSNGVRPLPSHVSWVSVHAPSKAVILRHVRWHMGRRPRSHASLYLFVRLPQSALVASGHLCTLTSVFSKTCCGILRARCFLDRHMTASWETGLFKVGERFLYEGAASGASTCAASYIAVVLSLRRARSNRDRTRG